MQVCYAKAKSYIEQHGHFAAVTAEGLLATTWVREAVDHPGNLDGDEWSQEAFVFPIAPDNTVDARAIRDWLGY